MARASFASLGRKLELLEIFVMTSVVLFRWIPVDGLGQARGESDPKDPANLSDKEAETSLTPKQDRHCHCYDGKVVVSDRV